MCEHTALTVFNYAEQQIHTRCPECIYRRRTPGHHTLEVRSPPSCLPLAVERYNALKTELKLYYKCLTVTETPYKFTITLNKEV